MCYFPHIVKSYEQLEKDLRCVTFTVLAKPRRAAPHEHQLCVCTQYSHHRCTREGMGGGSQSLGVDPVGGSAETGTSTASTGAQAVVHSCVRWKFWICSIFGFISLFQAGLDPLFWWGKYCECFELTYYILYAILLCEKYIKSKFTVDIWDFMVNFHTGILDSFMLLWKRLALRIEMYRFSLPLFSHIELLFKSICWDSCHKGFK